MSTKWKKGNGEMVSFAVVSIAICSLFIIIVSFLQLSIGLNTITKASNVVARSVAVCTSKKDADKQAQLVAESAISGSDIEDIRTSVEYATSNKEWQSGNFVKVNVRAKVKTLAPFIPFEQDKSVLICIENKEGLIGDTIEEQVWNYLTSQGFNAYATAGIMGNMYQESGVDPMKFQNGGSAAGICQWENYKTKSGRWKNLENFANAQGKDWTDLQSQLDFMIYELQGGDITTALILNSRYGGITNFKNATSTDWATEAFENSFERAGKPMMEKRKAKAREYYNRYRQ